MQTNYLFVIMFSMLVCKSIAQQVSLTGKVINPNEKPVKEVLVYLANNPAFYCYSDSLGNFSLTDQVNTSVVENRQNEIISFENRNLSIYADNQSISVDVITLIGVPILNILNLSKTTGTIELYPEAYITDLPKAIYIVRVRVGGTFRSYKIQNIIPSGFPQGIAQYDITNRIDNSNSKPKLILKSGISDTLVLVHDFYKSRKMPLSTYTMQYDTIHLNNFADYTIAEGFEPSVTYWYNGYANFTNIYSKDSAQFIIDYDTLSILKGDLKVIAIPVDKIESLDTSITFISGLHFEPSGTKFLQSVQITVLMKGSIPEDLVVFQCNDMGETYYLPFVTHVLYDDYCIVFNINHFSRIGIGTGDIHPPTDNPEGFTKSDQFLSYLDEYMRYYKSVGTFGGIPEELFTVWFNNVVAPMISKINTWEDFGAAIDEFLLLAETWGRFGNGTSFTDLSFYDTAREMFCNKMMKIWNELIVEYNGLNDNCLKREILDIALSILKENALLGGLCTELSHPNLSDMNVFGNGEFFNLAQKIEFAKQIKHLEAGESYVVEYTLKSFSGNPIPEVVVWSSNNPSVATVNTDGKVTAHSNGETIITGKICDIENTHRVLVGGVNCEKQYCFNEYGSCYSPTKKYKCTGVVMITRTEHDYCGSSVLKWVDRFTMVGELNTRLHIDYEDFSTFRHENYWMGLKCGSSYSVDDGTSYQGYFWCSKTALASFYFDFDTFHYYVQNNGYLKDDMLILDVRYNAGDAGYKNTKFFCPCIGK